MPMMLAQVATPGVLDQTQELYRITARGWLGPMLAMARPFFLALATIQIVMSVIAYVLTPEERRDGLLGRFAVTLVVLSFVWSIMSGVMFWLAPVVTDMASIGTVTGLRGTIQPSEVWDLGVYLAFWAIDTRDLPVAMSSFATAAFALVARFVILGAFAAVTVGLILAWVESYVVLATGPLFLAFGASRITASYAENYINYLVFLGLRLGFFYLVLGVGTTVLGKAIGAMPPAMAPDQMAGVTVSALIFATLVLRVPTSAASRITSGVSFGLRDALR